jgi:hypothetical protein
MQEDVSTTKTPYEEFCDELQVVWIIEALRKIGVDKALQDL